MKIAINTRFGGFHLSDAAYEKLIEYGIPKRKYSEEKHPENEGFVIFDSQLGGHKPLFGRYWDTWTRNYEHRTHPLIIQVVEELGEKANSSLSDIKIVEIPDDVEWEISEYDGVEHVAEKHRTWY